GRGTRSDSSRLATGTRVRRADDLVGDSLSEGFRALSADAPRGQPAGKYRGRTPSAQGFRGRGLVLCSAGCAVPPRSSAMDLSLGRLHGGAISVPVLPPRIAYGDDRAAQPCFPARSNLVETRRTAEALISPTSRVR